LRSRAGSGATGLWQILGQEVPGTLTDPLTNARNAVWKFRHQGLGAWEAYTNGAYKGYLTGNNASAKNVNVANTVKPTTRLDRVQAAIAQAQGTPDLMDDRFTQQRLVNYYRRQYGRAKRRHDPAGIAEILPELRQARQDLHALPTRMEQRASRFDARMQAGDDIYSQQVTDLENSLTVRGIDPTSAKGLGVVGLQAQTRLISLRARQKQLRAMLKAARHGGDRKAVKSIKQQLAGVHSQILGQRATITGLSNDYAAATAPATPLDFANADLSLAQLNDTEDPASLGDNLTALQKIQGLDQGALNDALQSGDPRKIAEAADALKSVNDNIKGLQDAINANTDAVKAQGADMATELKRQNDQMAAVRGSLQSTLTQWLADQVGSRVGGQAVLAAQTPGFAGQRVRY
jgi:hypothetical protein